MPTPITSHSAIFIDHVYYYESKKRSGLMEIESGNFVNDCLIICLATLYC